MSFLKKIFGKKQEEPITDVAGFWRWFQAQAPKLHKIVKERKDVEKDFLDVVIPRLQELNERFFCLTGMKDDHTVELVVTAEGDIKAFVWVEELIAAAPVMQGWAFTALKPAIGITSMSISMGGQEFSNDTLRFYSNDYPDRPDEIDLTIVHKDYNERDKDLFSNGTLIYIDNLLGELNSALLIDGIVVTGPDSAEKELIPIDKLQEYLVWREKEFVEKYKGSWYTGDDDNYTALEAHDQEDMPLIAVVNSDLLKWDAKPSHPWMLVIEIKYPPVTNGMPDDAVYEVINDLSDVLDGALRGEQGYLYLGREIYKGTCSIYYACKEFRQSSKIVAGILPGYASRIEVSYDIFKDKYWSAMSRFQRR